MLSTISVYRQQIDESKWSGRALTLTRYVNVQGHVPNAILSKPDMCSYKKVHALYGRCPSQIRAKLAFTFHLRGL